MCLLSRRNHEKHEKQEKISFCDIDHRWELMNDRMYDRINGSQHPLGKTVRKLIPKKPTLKTIKFSFLQDRQRVSLTLIACHACAERELSCFPCWSFIISHDWIFGRFSLGFSTWTSRSAYMIVFETFIV